jgi:uncharacterized OB-fold protein
MISPVKIWRNQKKLSVLIGKKGKLVSWTLIRIPPAGFENQAPYPVALIKIDEGKTIIAQVVDYEEKDLKYGQKFITVIRRIMQTESSDVIPYGVKVKPV